MYGHRARIGYTSPLASTEVFPYEFYTLVPKGVTLVLTTLAVIDITADEVARSYEIALNAAQEMAGVGVDLVVLGGVPINVSRGLENVDDLIRDTSAKAGVPVTTSVSAQLDALRTTGARNVAIAHPFPADHQEVMLSDIVRRNGFQLTGAMGGGKTGRELGKIPLEMGIELCRMLKEDYPETDTMWLPCPHWAVVEAIDQIENELGVTVITANQAITWHALRRCGVTDTRAHFGRLFAQY